MTHHYTVDLQTTPLVAQSIDDGHGNCVECVPDTNEDGCEIGVGVSGGVADFRLTEVVLPFSYRGGPAGVALPVRFE